MGMITLPGFYRGDDHALRLEFRNKENGELIDLTDWTFISTIKLSSEMPDSEGIQTTYTVTSSSPPSLKGIVYLAFSHQKTRTLIPTLYQVDVQKTVAGKIQTLFVAKIPVRSDVTRGGSHV